MEILTWLLFNSILPLLSVPLYYVASLVLRGNLV